MHNLLGLLAFRIWKRTLTNGNLQTTLLALDIGDTFNSQQSRFHLWPHLTRSCHNKHGHQDIQPILRHYEHNRTQFLHYHAFLMCQVTSPMCCV